MARAGIVALALLSVLALACGDGGVTPPDAANGDGSAGDVDASDDVSALEFEWTLDPPLESSPEGPLELVITRARFSLEDLRAVGDAAVLMHSSFEIDFEQDDPPVLRFAPAPPGLYASLIGRIKGYDVRGTLRVGGQTEEFRIHDEPAEAVTFAIALQDVEVVPGDTEVVTLEIEIDGVIEELDWTTVEPNDGGVLDVDKNSDQIGDVRDELPDAFKVD